VGVVHVPFGFDRADLDRGAEAALAAIAKELRDNPSISIDLEGTTDAVGRLDYNVKLSQRRVETVRRWLVSHGIDRARIVGTKGSGPLADGGVKDDVKRRVMVKLLSSAE
jgi:OOP family OmpA-OmpF porin